MLFFSVPFQFPLSVGYFQQPAQCEDLPGTAHLSKEDMFLISSLWEAYWVSQIFFLGVNRMLCVCLWSYLFHFNGRNDKNRSLSISTSCYLTEELIEQPTDI